MDLGGPNEACIRRGAHWRHLANTTETSMFGGNASLCQITLTTCSVQDVQWKPQADWTLQTFMMLFVYAKNDGT